MKIIAVNVKDSSANQSIAKKVEINMNNFDVAGVLKTYSEKCRNARDDEHLKELVRDLKKELNSDEIRKLYVLKDS